MFLTPVRPEEPDAEHSQTMKEKNSASMGRVGVLSLQLLFELSVKDLIALVFSLLLGMELQCFFEALMNQKTFIQHLKIKSCYVKLTGLEREERDGETGEEGDREKERGERRETDKRET